MREKTIQDTKKEKRKKEKRSNAKAGAWSCLTQHHIRREGRASKIASFALHLSFRWFVHLSCLSCNLNLHSLTTSWGKPWCTQLIDGVEPTMKSLAYTHLLSIGFRDRHPPVQSGRYLSRAFYIPAPQMVPNIYKFSTEPCFLKGCLRLGDGISRSKLKRVSSVSLHPLPSV